MVIRSLRVLNWDCLLHNWGTLKEVKLHIGSIVSMVKILKKVKRTLTFTTNEKTLFPRVTN